MSIWSQYKVNNLPEEERAEVIKVIAHEVEETKRSKATNPGNQTVKIVTVVAFAISLIIIAFISYSTADAKFERDVKTHQPVICPPAPYACF
jgi:hypothetical protein